MREHKEEKAVEPIPDGMSDATNAADAGKYKKSAVPLPQGGETSFLTQFYVYPFPK